MLLHPSGITRGSDGLVAFYNHRRFRSTSGYLSSVQFEQRWLAAQQSATATPGPCTPTFGGKGIPNMPQLGRCHLLFAESQNARQPIA